MYNVKWTNDINLEREPGMAPVQPPDGLRIVSAEELLLHGAGSESPWLVVDGLVINVAEWQQRHPGGKVQSALARVMLL